MRSTSPIETKHTIVKAGHVSLLALISAAASSSSVAVRAITSSARTTEMKVLARKH
jgi:hypothetical protein